MAYSNPVRVALIVNDLTPLGTTGDKLIPLINKLQKRYGN